MSTISFIHDSPFTTRPMGSCPNLMDLRRFITVASVALIGFVSLIPRPELIPPSGAFRVSRLLLRRPFSPSSPLPTLLARSALEDDVSHDQPRSNAQQGICRQRRGRVSISFRSPQARRANAATFGVSRNGEMNSVHITGPPVRTLLDRFFESWRLCVFAFYRRDAKTQRREGGRPALPHRSPASPVLGAAFGSTIRLQATPGMHLDLQSFTLGPARLSRDVDMATLHHRSPIYENHN